MRRFSDAEQELDKAEQLSTKQDDKEYVWFLRGSTFEREKRYAEAEEQFKKVLASDPEHASALNYLGYMLADQNKKLDEALGYIKKAVDLDPANGAYLDSLGWAYFRLGKYELAEENLLKASQKINTDPTVHDHLGDLYQKTGRLKHGRHELGARADRVEPHDCGGSRSGRRSASAEEARLREDEAGQGRRREAVVSIFNRQNAETAENISS